METVKRGRGRKDVAERTRAVFWYYAVRDASGLSDEELDSKFVMVGSDGYERGIGRPHAFRRIRVFGVSPAYQETRRTTNNRDDPPIRESSLLDIVAREPGYGHTRDVYNSPFWRLITPPAPGLDEIRHIIDDLLNTTGRYRATDQDIQLGKSFCEDESPFVRRLTDEGPYKPGLEDIAEHGELNDLALLGALAREAAASYGLEQMPLIRANFKLCLRNVSFTYKLDTEIEKLLGWLASYRLFHNRWDPIPTEETRQQAKYDLDFKRKEQGLDPLKYNDFAIDALAVRLHKQSTVPKHAIVKMTAEIRELIHNRAKWQKAFDEHEEELLRRQLDEEISLFDYLQDSQAKLKKP